MKIEFKHKSFKLDKEKNKELYFNLSYQIKSDKEKRLRIKTADEIILPNKNKHIDYILTRKNDVTKVLIYIAKKINYWENITIFGNRFKDNEKLLKFKNIQVIAPEKGNLSNASYNLIRNHAKIYIINNYVIFGSANVSPANSDIEQYIIFNNKIFANFLNKEITKQLTYNKYKIILSHKISYPKTGFVNFTLINRGYSSKDILLDLNKHDNLEVTSFGITKKDIDYLTRLKAKFILTNTLKYFNKEAYIKLYKYENKEYLRLHNKEVFVNNLHIITSNNFSSKDNTDYTLIENI